MSVGVRNDLVNVRQLMLLYRRLAKVDEVSSEQDQNGKFGEKLAIACSKSAKSSAIRLTISTLFNHSILRFSPLFSF